MKKFILGFCLIAMLASCGSKNEQWEYKVVKVAGHDAEIAADFGTLVFADQTAMLNKMGKEGWELVSAYTETGTAFPNFGNSEYVTGIRDNTRTAVVNFVFKNQRWQGRGKKASKEKITRRNEIHCSIHINSIGFVVLFP